MNAKLLKNKWFLAMCVMAVVAAVAVAIALVVVLTPDKGPDTPETPVVENNYGTGEEGVYYYEVVDGTITLTLRDGTFTMSGKINKTGTYSVDGTTIALDFFKDEDGTATATLNGDTLSLEYDGAAMSFLKEINYTVTFEVDGGSEISSITVVNGKFAEKPDKDPTKDSHVFLGWYADAEFKTPFSFAETAVKSDLTIYARWAEKKVGVPDYTISFDLGYEGAPAIAPVTTVSGIAYGIPTPERQGYTFGGWWISMYEDATKLSYAYTEDKNFNADTTLFAVWFEDGAAKLNAPSVSVSDGIISWNPVDKATSYKLTVVDPEGNVLIDNETVAGTMKAFEFGSRTAGEYKISVVAVAQNADNNSAPADRYFANKTLDRVSDFRVENGILIFGEVANAQKYTITIDCGDDNHIHTDFDNGLSTTYYLANCKMQAGGIKVTVTASANGFAPSTSNVFVYEKNLDKIESVVYDADRDVFAWDSVPGALSYIITVTVDGKDYTFTNDMRTTFSTAGFTGDISVSVVPATDGYNSPEATIATCKKTAPVVPDGLSASADKIFWNAVAGATSYEVNIGGQSITTTTNELPLSEISGLTQGQTYAVKVKAFNAADESSAFSSEISVGYFVMENTLKYNKNTVTWTPVLGVNRYMVRVNGGEAQIVNNATSAKIVFTKSGENVIEVCFVNGDATSDWVSLSVTAYPVEYDSRTTANGIVAVEYLAPGDLMSLPTPSVEYPGYDFIAWYNIPTGSTANGKKFDETSTFNGSNYTVVYGDWTPKTYDVTLRTDGHNVTNVENGATESATYTKSFTLPVPTLKDAGMYFFSGWYTGPNGSGTQITDELGVSLVPYHFTHGISLYPFYTTNALDFILQIDGTYAVTKGPEISSVVNLKIPVTYREIPVTKVLESAFGNNSTMKTVEIPDTIKLVGTNAFGSCTALEAVNIYVAYPDKAGTYETIYSSIDGVLFREDVGSTYLEFFPCGKLGEYTIPDSADKILTKAFKYAKLSTIVIPDNITSIPDDTFYYCKNLENIIFEANRTNNIEFTAAAFKECAAVKTIVLPANISMAEADLIAFLNTFGGLNSITVEDGGEKYASYDRLLTNKEKNSILYAPKGYTALAGAFSVPSGIYTIAENAFKSCTQITSVEIPVWVTSIGKNAFSSCSLLETITIKGGRSDALSIGTNAFAYLISLKSITFQGDKSATELDAGAVTIGEGAFRASASDKSSVRTFTVEDYVNITSIGKNAFLYQSKLTTIDISKKANLTTIGESAFSYCTRLSAIEIPATVTTVGKSAFANCTNITSITFATEGATTLDIQDAAFKNCPKLTEILLPDHLGAFNASVFDECDFLKSINVNPTNPNYISDEHGILYKRGANSDVIAELIFYPKGLAKELNGKINNLPDTLTSIGASAFYANKFITEVTIPKTVTAINASAFASCSNLTNVNFSAEGTSLTIAANAFKECYALTDSFELPSYTKSIGANAFEDCTFTKFVVPEKVTTISKAAFINCKNLETVIFKGNGALSLGSDASATTNGVFANCTALKSVDLPDGTTVVGKYTFYNCTALESVELGKKLKTLNVGAFNLCTKLKSVVLPKTVTTVGDNAFAMTSALPGSLESVIFEEGGTAALTVGKTVFNYHPNLTVVTFPARTSKLAGEAAPSAASTKASNVMYLFVGCDALEEVNIANDGTSQGFASKDGVLYDAAMEALIFCPRSNNGTEGEFDVPTLVVPKTVKTVMSGAIINSQVLKTIIFEEFDKTDANYGQQLLAIGNYTSSTASYYTTESNLYKDTDVKYNIVAIGGSYSSVSTIVLPSHFYKVCGGAFANKVEAPMTLVVNPDSDNYNLMNYAFIYAKFDKIILPGTVDSLGNFMFRSCKYMTEVEVNFKESVTALPQGLFYSCAKLENYVIPEHINELGSQVFYGCKAMSGFYIPHHVTKIGSGAFTSFTTDVLRLHPYLASIGSSAFSSCSVTEVIFEFDENGKSAITQLPDSIFSGCTKLKTINLGELNPTVVGQKAFYNCDSIQIDFTQLTKLQNIGNESFSHSNSMIHVDLSKTLIENLGPNGNAFYNCPNMESFVFPPNITAVKAAVFNNNAKLNTVVLTDLFQGAWVSVLFAQIVYDYDPVEIIIPENNPYLVADEHGVIYDNAKQIIYNAARGNLVDYVMPDTVLTIGENSFRGVTADEIIISENVMEILKGAFQYSDVKSVYIPASVEMIYDSAFSDSGLQKVEFAKDSRIQRIGSYTFKATELEEVVLPDNLDLTDKPGSTKVTPPMYLFQNSQTIKSVTFGAAVKVTPSAAFYGCTAIEEIIFQEGTEQIKDLFSTTAKPSSTNTSLKEVTIPASVTTLVKASFNGFAGLETVTFANGSKLKTIETLSFNYCHSLKELNGIPASLQSLATKTFTECNALETLDLEHTKIQTIAESTFTNCYSLTSLKLPAGLLTIGDSAFTNTGALDLYIPATVTSIGNSAFADSAIKSVTFPAESALSVLGTLEGESNIFRNCADLQIVTISNDLTTIGNNVFQNSGVTKVVLANPEAPTALHTIGDRAFYECPNITEFNSFANIQSIGDFAFYEAKKLTTADFGDNIQHLGGMAFGFCDSLPAAKFPKTLNSLGGNPYAGLDVSLIEFDDKNKFFTAKRDENGGIAIYDKDESVLYATYGISGEFVMGEYALEAKIGAFAGTDVTSTTIPKAFGVVAEALFMNCEKLESVVVDDAITAIGDRAFYNCVSLVSTNIPANTTSIGDYAYYNCQKLSSKIYIPNTALDLGNYVFAECKSLKDVEFESSISTDYAIMGTHFFYNCESLDHVTLPTLVQITVEDGTASGQTTASYHKKVIPSYTFAGTGIVNAVLPENVSYFYTRGVFENCKKLERLTYTVPPKAASSEIYLLDKENWFTGCENEIAAYAYSLNPTGDTNFNFARHLQGGITILHLEVFGAHAKKYPFVSSAYFDEITSEFKMYIDGETYLEIIEGFKSAPVPWTFEVYDKDGNRLYSNAKDGQVAYVTNPAGEVIWGTKPAA